MEERPSRDNPSQEIMSHSNSTTLNNTQGTRLNSWGHFQFIVSPNDGFNQLLPITPTAEQEHQAKGKDEMSSQEHDAIGGNS
jgi:hypothetical protein